MLSDRVKEPEMPATAPTFIVTFVNANDDDDVATIRIDATSQRYAEVDAKARIDRDYPGGEWRVVGCEGVSR